jgi:hypothetical protein
MESFSDLRCFCDYMVRKYGSPDVTSEEQKAEEFRGVYLKDLPFNMMALRAIAASCGVKLNALEKMPRNLRGYHEVYGSNKSIYFRKDDTLSGIENTILHEIREMMETLFTEANPEYEPLRTSARHIAANRFATAVLLPRESFIVKVYDTGLDVVELASIYSKSCSQVLLRMGEVLQGKLFFYGSLYEPDPEDGATWAVTYWTGSCNNEDPEANIYGVDRLFPRKGRLMIPESPADIALKKMRTCFVRRITVLDDSEEGSLVAIARPLIVSNAVTKVSLVALLSQNSSMLKPQIERTNPVVVDNFRGHL